MSNKVFGSISANDALTKQCFLLPLIIVDKGKALKLITSRRTKPFNKDDGVTNYYPQIDNEFFIIEYSMCLPVLQTPLYAIMQNL